MTEEKGKGRDTSDVIYGKLLELITNGTYGPGSRIPPENELKDLFGVSRNTIRAVLNRLSALGIIETRRGDGSFVRGVGANLYLNMLIPSILFDKHELIEILEFRKGIEVQAVKLAAMRADSGDITLLRAQSKKHALCKNTDQLHKMNTELHIQIARASKNKMFSSMLEIIQHILTDEMRQFLLDQGEDIDSAFYHNTIIECIANHKPEEAAFMMDKHLDLVVERVKQFHKMRE